MIALGGPTLKLGQHAVSPEMHLVSSLNDSTGRAYTETFPHCRSEVSLPVSMIALGGPTLKLEVLLYGVISLLRLNDSTGRAYTETLDVRYKTDAYSSLNDSTGRAYTETTWRPSR